MFGKAFGLLPPYEGSLLQNRVFVIFSRILGGFAPQPCEVCEFHFVGARATGQTFPKAATFSISLSP